MTDQDDNAKFAPIEAVKLFNEFQSQFRARIEATVKLVLVVSGTMLTLSVGAVLREAPPSIPAHLLPALEWGWLLLFYSIAASLLFMLTMILATFHVGLVWQKELQRGNERIEFIATSLWLRAFNGVLGCSVLLSCVAGIALVAYVALGVAESLAS